MATLSSDIWTFMMSRLLSMRCVVHNRYLTDANRIDCRTEYANFGLLPAIRHPSAPDTAIRACCGVASVAGRSRRGHRHAATERGRADADSDGSDQPGTSHGGANGAAASVQARDARGRPDGHVPGRVQRWRRVRGGRVEETTRGKANLSTTQA